MNKKEFIKKFAERIDLPVNKTYELTNKLEALVLELISQGETILFHGFCEIGVKEFKDRTGIHPINSEPITIKGGKRVYIKPKSSLKAAVQSER